jgi:hypothetical protein
MNKTPPTLKLLRGETLSIDGDRRGQKLQCLAGQVWITQAGDTADHLLFGGREFAVTRPGRVVVQALTPWAILADIAA